MTKLGIIACAAAVALLCVGQARAVTINVARLGTASQSTTAYGGSASRGNDGGLGDNYTLDASTTHTNASTPGNYWQVDLGAVYDLTSTTLYNRGDCCGNRLSNFRISVLDASQAEVWGQDVAGPIPQGGSQTFAIPDGTAGQTLKVQLNGRNNDNGYQVSLTEVVVEGKTTVPHGANIAALYGVADQSSTLNNSRRPAAHRAIDGNTSGAFNNGSVTHTNHETQPQWGVDLTAEVPVDHLRIYERTDGCCNGRLDDFSVTLYDPGMNPLFTQDVTNGVSTYVDIPVPYGVDARHVGVQMMDTGSTRTLELAEVQVIGSEPGVRNVARNPLAVASQSTTRTGSGANVASAAIDGITDGRWGSNSTTHTLDQAGSWWQVDLGGDFNIEEIDLFNRTDCCGGRLSDFRLALLDDGAEVWGQDYFTDGTSVPQGGSFAVALDGLVGDTVRIDSLGLNDHGDHVLSLAEVQVWATPEPTTLSLLGLGALALLRRRRR